MDTPHFLIIGLGESGLASARWLARTGARLRIVDSRAQPTHLEPLRQYLPTAEFITSTFAEQEIPALLKTDDGEINEIIISPGLSPHHQLAPLISYAAQRNIPVIGEIELFARALADLRTQQQYTPKVVAVTGTNGKTTVTRLTGLLLERAGYRVQIAGNISPAALDVLRLCIDEQNLPQIWVLELSSFQLHSTFSLNPDAAAILNITEDHLDWHSDQQEYTTDKARIIGPTTRVVLNRDDPAVMALIDTLPPSTNTERVITFGLDAPSAPQCLGLVREQGIDWLALAEADRNEDAPTPSKRSKKDASSNPDQSIIIKRLMPSGALQIAGRHNTANVCAVLGLCRLVGAALPPLLHGLREYTGEPHRLQKIATIAGVTYYDDSKGTNVGATVAALQGFDRGRKVILIAGGDGKGQDFSPLILPIQQSARAVILIGKDGPQLQQVLGACAIPLINAESLEEATQTAARLAQTGDIVLLSPACASWDMFKNYAHRAEVFIETVRDIALTHGEVVL